MHKNLQMIYRAEIFFLMSHKFECEFREISQVFPSEFHLYYFMLIAEVNSLVEIGVDILANKLR